jgi:2-dehydro-3-deoxygluconokinase
VEKRSRDGRETNRAFQADWVLPGLKEGMILTGQQTPEGIADFYLSHGVRAVIIKTGSDGAWYKTAMANRGRLRR